MPDTTTESRKRSRSPSAEANNNDQHHHKRLNVGTDAEHPRSQPVAVPPAGTGEDELMDGSGTDAAQAADVAMADGSQSKDFKQMVHMRCLIMTQDASVIIGKGGSHIAEIRKKSGARVLVSEAVQGNPERILNISGQLEAVAKAFGLIARRMNDEPFDTTSGPNSRAVTIRLAIPHPRMGSVIGKGGVKIKEIQEQSGAQLKASEGMLPNSTERILNIVGVADAIHIAAYHIGNVLLEAQKVHGATNSALYKPAPPGMFNQGPPPNMFGRPGAPPANFGGPGAFGGPQGPAMGYGAGFQGPVGPGMQGPRPGHPMGPAGPMGPYNAGPVMQPGFAPNQQRPPFMNGPQAVPGPYNMGPNMGAPVMQFGAMSGPAAMGPGMVGAMGGPVTQEVNVPADLIGTIIGKGGAKINELRQMSSSQIKVLDPAPGPAGANQPRKVTISGQPHNVQIAVNMLNQRLQYERQKQMRQNMGGAVQV